MRASTLLWTALLASGLSACSSLPSSPAQPARFDLGPLPVPAAAPAAVKAYPVLALADIQARAQNENSTAVLYRLAYADAHALHAYGLARWSQRDTFGQTLGSAVEAFEAADDRTLVVRLKRPFPRQVKPGHDIALLHLLRVFARPGVVLARGVIGGVDLGVGLPQRLREIRPVSVAHRVRAPAAHQRNGLRHHIHIRGDGHPSCPLGIHIHSPLLVDDALGDCKRHLEIVQLVVHLLVIAQDALLPFRRVQ